MKRRQFAIASGATTLCGALELADHRALGLALGHEGLALHTRELGDVVDGGQPVAQVETVAVRYVKYDLVLNQGTARAIGLGLPPRLVLRASKVVE